MATGNARCCIRVTCSGERRFSIRISLRDTVRDLKNILARNDGYLRSDITRTKPPGHIRLFFNGQLLEEDERALGDYGLCDESCVMAAVSQKPSHDAHDSENNEEDQVRVTVDRFAGFERLRSAGLSSAEIDAIRNTFFPAVEQWAEGRPGLRNESPHSRLLRLEEEWMLAQPSNSEFRTNTGLYAVRNRLGGVNIRSIENRETEGSAEGQQVTRDGTREDFVAGIIMGFLLGFIVVFWVWEGSMTRMRKRGVIVGIGLNVLLQLVTGNNKMDLPLKNDEASPTNATTAEDNFADFTRIGEAGIEGEKMLVIGHP